MGEFLIECSLCGVSYETEKLYDSHPCMSEDVKVPFKIKLEHNNEEAELESEVQKAFDEALLTPKVEPFSTLNIKEEPDDVDFEDVDPLGIGQNEVFANDEEAIDNLAEMPESLEAEVNKESAESNNIAGSSINECLVCGKRFFKREDLLTHKMNSHKVPRPYECSVCKKKFTQKHYVALHMRVHTGERPYKCTLCSNTYTHKTSFTIHMRIHNGDRPYRCGLCGKRCYDKSGLTSHMRSHTKETPYECEVCGRRFTHSKSLLVHRRNHTGEKPYKCQYCGKCFRHWHKHKIHVRLHTGERPYRCKVCGKGFPRNDEVKRHMRSHQGIKSFKCSICSVYCATQASITGHIDLHHSDLKPNVPTAPEKTLVRDSLSGTLGTKAPQPRTIYKTIASLSSAVDGSTNTAPVVTTAQNKNISSKQGSDGKPKLLSYKEYIELQEKILTDKGLQVKDPKKKALSQVTSVTAANCKASTSKASITSLPQKHAILTNNGKQIMILSPQALQTGGGGAGVQLVLPGQIPPAASVRTIAPAVSTATDQQFVVGQSSMVLNQQQVLGGQQLIVLTPSGAQQSGIGGISQQLLLLTGGNGNGGHRFVLLPKQASAQVGGQTMVIPSIAPVSTSAPILNVANSSIQIKQEVIEPTSLVPEQNALTTIIKQEPGVKLPKGIVIKQEPVENIPLSSSGLCNVVIKQEPSE